MDGDELRAWDQFAAAALPGVIAIADASFRDNPETEPPTIKDWVSDAARVADALMVERAKRTTAATRPSVLTPPAAPGPTGDILNAVMAGNRKPLPKKGEPQS